MSVNPPTAQPDPTGAPDNGGFPPPPIAFEPPAPAPAPKKKFTWVKILVPVLVVLVGGGIAAYNFFGSVSTVTATPGDCFAVTQFNAQTEPSKVDCAAPEANVKVGVKLDNATDTCPTGTDGQQTYDEISMTGMGSVKLCLTLNVAQGDCLAGLTAKETGYKKVTCADPTAEAEFVKVTNDASGQAACEGTEADNVLVYPQPAQTLCFKMK